MFRPMSGDGVYVSNFESNNLIEGTYSKHPDGSFTVTENFLDSDDSFLNLTNVSGKSETSSLTDSESIRGANTLLIGPIYVLQ